MILFDHPILTFDYASRRFRPLAAVIHTRSLLHLAFEPPHPYADDSGKSHGRRRIRGGRSRLRRMFYMAARTAVGVDAGLREFYQGLVARGKPKQLALIAVARKLVVIVNHMFRDNRPYLAQPSSVS